MKPRYLHVGSMNIEHFGRDDDRTENQYAIAEHIELSGVAILALQELYVTNPAAGPGAAFENSFLRASLDLITEHTGQIWHYEIFPNKAPGDRSQLCGVAWNASRVEKVGAALKLQVEPTAIERSLQLNLWDRHPHAVKFKALPGQDSDIKLTDFVVVSLHMKSNVGDRHTTMRTRYHEARELMAQVKAIEQHFEETEIVFLGDTNCKNRDEDAIQEFVINGFEDLNEDDVPTYYSGGNAPFDRIFVRRDRKPFLYSRQYVLRSASPLSHDRYISDHYMVKMTMVIRRDDD